MGFLDRLFGGSGYEVDRRAPSAAPRRRVPDDDELAIERYRYLIRTAPPETIEQVHAEAFARLSDEQRALIYEELSRGAGTGERPMSSEPATLARAATRAELRQPGRLEQILRSTPADGGPGFGTLFASSLLGSVAGYVIGSALVSAFLPWGGFGGTGEEAAEAETAAADDGGFGDFGDFGGGFDI